ncbi:hypothetical protein NLJ89_g8834 [Agrocybe chaxingu]|uniref:Uncharacterized protein n=1 Tax=Agrocybe chaxingu TaxID=84603 RepID=A0A9W8JTL5_9AGAR|nr:hypothetical protein NLJ89_g8834 [Agrocybe chaxingu]
MSSSMLESLTIRHFSFSTLTDFVKILNSCRHLKTLQFDNVDISAATNLSTTNLSTSALEHVLNLQHSNILSPAAEKKAPLNNLLLRSSSLSLFIPILLHARSPLDLSGLRSLVINITLDNYLNVLDLLRYMPDLESLQIEIDPSFDYETHLERRDVIDLHLLPSLTTLSLHVHILLGRIDPLPWLYTLLSSARPDNRLASVSLTCVVNKAAPEVTIHQIDAAFAGWRNLDNLLVQPSFGPLKRFRLDLALDRPVGDDAIEQVSRDFVEELGGLAKKGILEVEVYEAR